MNRCSNVALQSYMKWKIGNDLRNILTADTEVQALVGDKIFPLIAPENIVGDFIIYERAKYSKSWTKMGVYEDECNIAITIVSDKYDNSIDIAEKVDLALVGEHWLNNHRLNIDLVDSTENFENNKYIQVLIYSIK